MERQPRSPLELVRNYGKTALFVLAAMGLLGGMAYEADRHMGTLPRETDQTKEVLPAPKW